jgi:multiple antibiotic resistance protein
LKELLIAVRYIPLAFSALIPVINPVGSAVLFLGFVQGVDHSTRKSIARKVAINTVWFLVVVLVVGTLILRFFGISLPVVQVAGGFVLAAMGWSLLNKPESAAVPASNDQSASALDDMVFYPLTFPLTAGPACVVVTLTLGAHASRGPFIDILIAHLGALIGIVLIGVLVYISYAYADRTTARMSASMTQGILRIISFILFCIGAEIMWNGIQALAKTIG